MKKNHIVLQRLVHIILDELLLIRGLPCLNVVYQIGQEGRLKWMMCRRNHEKVWIRDSENTRPKAE